MKYFLDTEFLEGTQRSFFGKTKPTIDLISIAMVDENGREFYSISKDFNLKEAWNRWQQRTGQGDRNNNDPRYYWIRENVLYPVFLDLVETQNKAATKALNLGISLKYFTPYDFSYKNLKNLLNAYGRTNKQIANDICAFIYGDDCGGSGMSAIEMACKYEMNDKSKNPEFYGYYSDYDWVVFCWLFGKMNDLPKGFPMYCRDLKQKLDEKIHAMISSSLTTGIDPEVSLDEKLKIVKNSPEYPKNQDSHNSLSDAKWNKEVYKFLQNISNRE